MRRYRSRSGRLGGVVITGCLLVAVLAACGSGSSTDTSMGPAGAKENATAAPECFDLYRAGVQVPCAENTIGPGGGVIFYDAKIRQRWGQFLEVAPWNWNPILRPDETNPCAHGCGADERSILHPVLNGTQDRMMGGVQIGRSLCYFPDSTYHDLSGEAVNTGEALGKGRANTAALLADPACGTDLGHDLTVLGVVAAYRGGGLNDWYLPSKDELLALCYFGNRNGVGGFNDKEWYATSSTEARDWTLWRVATDDCNATTIRAAKDVKIMEMFLVRPIRAF